MAKESSVSLSTVSLRLIKPPEHRPEFEKKMVQELREALNIPEPTPITTMPDSPFWWQRAKEIAEGMEAERRYAEEHPECAKSPTGKHEWRFGTCVWCGTPATEVKTETPSFHVKYIDLTTGKRQEKTIPEKEQFDLYKQQREGKISIISIKPETKSEEIKEDHAKMRLLEKLIRQVDEAMRDEEEAWKMYDAMRTDIVTIFPVGSPEYDIFIEIVSDERRHHRDLDRIKSTLRRRLEG